MQAQRVVCTHRPMTNLFVYQTLSGSRIPASYLLRPSGLRTVTPDLPLGRRLSIERGHWLQCACVRKLLLQSTGGLAPIDCRDKSAQGIRKLLA